jgi:hypothetical protein
MGVQDFGTTKIAQITGINASLEYCISKSMGELNPLDFLETSLVGLHPNPSIFAGNAGEVVDSLCYLLSAYSLCACNVWCGMGFAAAVISCLDQLYSDFCKQRCDESFKL